MTVSIGPPIGRRRVHGFHGGSDRHVMRLGEFDECQQFRALRPRRDSGIVRTQTDTASAIIGFQRACSRAAFLEPDRP